jgi:hypothetical protein
MTFSYHKMIVPNNLSLSLSLSLVPNNLALSLTLAHSLCLAYLAKSPRAKETLNRSHNTMPMSAFNRKSRQGGRERRGGGRKRGGERERAGLGGGGAVQVL